MYDPKTQFSTLENLNGFLKQRGLTMLYAQKCKPCPILVLESGQELAPVIKELFECMLCMHTCRACSLRMMDHAAPAGPLAAATSAG